MVRKPRIIVGDAHRIFTAALEGLLAGECEILNTAPGAQGLLDDVRRLRPEVVLNGLSTDAQKGLQELHDIHQASPDTAIVVLTRWDDVAIAAEAFRVGASAYVLQTCAPSELVEAIHAAIAHRSYVTPHVASGTIQSLLTPAPDDYEPLLTPRQRAVVQQLADGKSMKEIGAALHLTPRTIAFHKYRVMRMLKITSSAALVRFAVKRGLA